MYRHDVFAEKPYLSSGILYLCDEKLVSSIFNDVENFSEISVVGVRA